MADEKYGIATGYNNSLIQDYLGYAKGSIASKKGASQQSLDASTSMLYDTLGRNQLQTERDIAKRRIMAQRTGMSSSQLAAMEMQNIMVGQLGAKQIADQYRLERAGLETQFAGAEDDIYAGLFETLNANRGQVAAVDAQKFSSSAITQIQEVFPDAPREVQLALVQKFMGYELDSNDQKLIDEYLKKGRGADSKSKNPLNYDELLAMGTTV